MGKGKVTPQPLAKKVSSRSPKSEEQDILTDGLPSNFIAGSHDERRQAVAFDKVDADERGLEFDDEEDSSIDSTLDPQQKYELVIKQLKKSKDKIMNLKTKNAEQNNEITQLKADVAELKSRRSKQDKSKPSQPSSSPSDNNVATTPISERRRSTLLFPKTYQRPMKTLKDFRWYISLRPVFSESGKLAVKFEFRQFFIVLIQVMPSLIFLQALNYFQRV